MSGFFFTPKASADAEAIHDYIARDRVGAAQSWVRALDEKCGLLAAQPGIGRRRDDLRPGLRGYNLGKYVIFYREKHDRVEIVRVLHCSRDIAEIFSSDP